MYPVFNGNKKCHQLIAMACIGTQPVPAVGANTWLGLQKQGELEGLDSEPK